MSRRSTARASASNTEAENAEAWTGGDEAENTEEADAARREATTSASGIAQAGPALTDAQLEGLDPVDVETHLDQAARRAELTNMQTDHEAENGLDAVSGSPNPGVTEQQSAAHTQPGARGSDMSGRAPVGDPLTAVERKAVEGARKALEAAEAQDIANGNAKADTDAQKAAVRRSAGWRSARQLAVHKATLDALVQRGLVEVGEAPGMAHHPDTGRLYRIAKDRG